MAINCYLFVRIFIVAQFVVGYVWIHLLSLLSIAVFGSGFGWYRHSSSIYRPMWKTQEMSQNSKWIWPYSSSGSSKVIDLGVNGKPIC